MTDRRALTIPALLAASAVCVATVVVRNHHAGNTFYGFLVWNLALAWIPFVLALLFYDGQRREMRTAGLAVLGALWLVFFPNAPYIVTDFVHAPHTGDVVKISSLYESSYSFSYVGGVRPY